jgi:hypothetical protein
VDEANRIGGFLTSMVLFAMVGAACTGGSPGHGPTSSSPARSGGTLRVGVQFLMTNVVARVPLVVLTTGRVAPTRVSGLTFDQSDAEPMPSLDRVMLTGAPPSPSPTTLLQVPGIPDGLYRTTITKADLYRFDPHYDPGGVDENTGTTTISLRGGWFETIQSADHPVDNPIGVGTYTGTGDRVVFDLLEPSYNAINTPDMRWTFDGHRPSPNLPGLWEPRPSRSDRAASLR